MMKKNLNYYLQLPFTVRIKQNADSTYFGEIEELPGCMTEADTEKDVLEMLEDAKETWIAVAIERDQPVPEPTHDEFSGKFNLRLPKSLHRQLAYQAKHENVSLNTLLITKLAS